MYNYNVVYLSIIYTKFKKNGLCFVYTAALAILFLRFLDFFLVEFFVVWLDFLLRSH